MLRIRAEQMSTMRRKRIGDALISQLAPFVGAYWDAPNQHVMLEDASGPRGSLGFDDAGFLAGYTSPLGRSWTLGNDPNGRLLSFTSPSGHVLSMAYTGEGLLGSFETTTEARVDLAYVHRHYVASLYTDGTAEQVAYTPEGDPALFQSRRGDQVQCTYDDHRRMTALADGNGHVTRFRYSHLNLPVEVLHPNGQRDTYRYAEDGTLAGATQGDEAQAEVKNDVLGRPLAVRFNDGTEAAFTYTEAGLLAGASGPAGAHSFAYDEKGQFVAEDAGAYQHTHAYDAAGRLMATTSLGLEVRFRWDADSRLIGITDWSGGEHTLEYLPADRGHVHTRAGRDGGVGVRSFVHTDTAGRLADLQVSAGGESRFSIRCGYDLEGRLSSFEDSGFGTRNFSYDADSRLTFVGGVQRHETFSYDRAANLAAINGVRHIYDGANQLLEAGETTLRWDDRGNLVAYAGPEGEVRLRFNARNQLVASTSTDGTETTYAYDPLGRRTSKRTGEVETRFFWAGEQMTCEIRADLRTGALRRQDYLYHPETAAPLLTAVDGEVFQIHTDQLGTPRALTSAMGEVVWLADYAAFGEARVTVDRVSMPLRFRGQYDDVESGLHYNRFRYYAPQWGRYISRDPLTFAAGTNHYIYVNGNPLNELDATGLISWKGFAALAAGAAAGALVGVGLGLVLGPGAAPIAILVGGIVAGAVAGGLNEALNEKHFCLSCIARAAGLGALAGAVGALPFMALPLLGLTGLLAVGAAAGAGLFGGALSYGVNCLDGQEKNPSWTGLAASAGLGMVLGGVGESVGGALRGTPDAPPPPDVATPPAPVARPTWRQSEIDVGTDLGPNYNAQQSFLNGRPVSQGTPGSVRPDYVANDLSTSVEVKNYKIDTNSNGLINNVSGQAVSRSTNLPAGMDQQVIVDVRGQNVSPAQENTIIQGIVQKSNGAISPTSITFKR